MKELKIIPFQPLRKVDPNIYLERFQREIKFLVRMIKK